MKLKAGLYFIIAFTALRFTLHELHELVHTAAGRMICGCWGSRDFNNWSLCNDCFQEQSFSVLATFGGPAFTFATIWTAVLLLNSNNTPRRQLLGFVLIFASNPFARIFTAVMGGGDEIAALKRLLHDPTLAWILGLAIVLALTVYPLYRAWKFIGNKNRIGWFLLFLLGPMLLDGLILFVLMNWLLKQGILESYWILGSPVLVTVFTLFTVIVLAATWKKIFTLSISSRSKLRW